MMPHEMTTTAHSRLQHVWELQGAAGDPSDEIRQIASEIAARRHGMRRQLEEVLLEQWALLCAEDGDER